MSQDLEHRVESVTDCPFVCREKASSARRSLFHGFYFTLLTFTFALSGQWIRG